MISRLKRKANLLGSKQAHNPDLSRRLKKLSPTLTNVTTGKADRSYVEQTVAGVKEEFYQLGSVVALTCSEIPEQMRD
ncbi:MAG: hypothetical protein ACLRZG_06970 [Streptococcus sp.]